MTDQEGAVTKTTTMDQPDTASIPGVDWDAPLLCQIPPPHCQGNQGEAVGRLRFQDWHCQHVVSVFICGPCLAWQALRLHTPGLVVCPVCCAAHVCVPAAHMTLSPL